MAKERSVGVSIISILLMIGAIIEIIAAFAIFGLGSVGITGLLGPAMTIPAVAAMTIGILILIIGLVELLVAGGLWATQKWAWVIAVIVLWIDIVFDIIGGLIGTQAWGGVFLSLIIPVIVLIYLSTGSIKSEFQN